MGETFSGTAPIYLQIVNKTCSQIVRGDLKPGDKLPSVRELALQYGVNPNTVQRVYMELEHLELSEARRGQGTFVTEDGNRLQALRNQLKQERIQSFIADMKEMGYKAEEIASGLQQFLQQDENGGGRSDG